MMMLEGVVGLMRDERCQRGNTELEGSTKDSNHEASLLRESQEETDIRECFNDSTRNIEKHVATQTKS